MLVSFGRGIIEDRAAVRAALAEPWSDGAAEGSVRKPDLLRAGLVVPA